jgi:hypothetical protein
VVKQVHCFGGILDTDEKIRVQFPRVMLLLKMENPAIAQGVGRVPCEVKKITKVIRHITTIPQWRAFWLDAQSSPLAAEARGRKRRTTCALFSS